jgi:hypothetical protein
LGTVVDAHEIGASLSALHPVAPKKPGENGEHEPAKHDAKPKHDEKPKKHEPAKWPSCGYRHTKVAIGEIILRFGPPGADQRGP